MNNNTLYTHQGEDNIRGRVIITLQYDDDINEIECDEEDVLTRLTKLKTE